MKKREPIKYMKLSEDSIFKTLKIRENPNDAFDNAIKRGLDNPWDYMYMYSENGRDYFKHKDTRKYKSYPQYGFLERVRNFIFR